MDEMTFGSHDEMMAYYEEELKKLEVRAKLPFRKEEKAVIGAEIERMKRFIATLRKTGGGIQHADMGSFSREDKSYG